MRLRLAEPSDIPAIVDLSRQVQDRLTATGSLQEFGPIPAETAAAHVTARTAFVLDDAGSSIGGVFVEPFASPVTPHLPGLLAGWNIDADTPGVWFLQKLMVAPELQGRGTGRVVLDGALAQVNMRGAARVALDCWAGNAKLRDFYITAGFRLHGVFSEGDYEVAVFVYDLRP